ncbi:MAG: replication factor C small subunit [Candidatus Nanoarchaeia archaeon]|nr:replication factor C small subunit [Candidatus Nanoarchaeia archaeon]
MLWTEKYRPKTFGDIKGQDKIVERIKAMVENKNIPHLLFSGPAGIGKTSLALVVARELYKGENWRENLLELNASDERGIDVIRNTIKDFARTKALGNVPFKLIYLDESDSLTKEAQHALRRTMENFTNNARFILSCNYASKLIDPIHSRCSVFHFKPLLRKDIENYVKFIAKSEGLKIGEGVIDALYNSTEGDVRRIVNILQSCSALTNNITEEVIYSVVSAARPKEIKMILEETLKGNFISARERLLEVMLQHGLSGLDVIKQIQKELISLKIDDRKKMDMIEVCGEIEFRMVEGSDEFLQLQALLARFSRP